ncbi:hypothetical protein LSM04_007006 [Trypanosoma melophagium]|uniref:uncharacterized protein n=1 Tax=Trypanosoma melophagium TaxID=715481 RepID=UPI00351A3408|nr:hypothetical protein LSM04_007006 [Trypanosoma melophagium]
MRNHNTNTIINNNISTSNMDRTAITSDTLQLRWCPVRSFNTHVVDLIDPFVSSSVNSTLSPEVNSDPTRVSTLRHLVLHSVRDFVQHMERVVVTPSFSTVRESLSHIFWFTQWGISYIVCIVQETHTSVFMDPINSTLDLSEQEEAPLSFLRNMQAVKKGEEEEEVVVPTINGNHIVNIETSHSTSSLLSLQGFETSINVGPSSHHIVSHLKERLQLEEERLKQLTGELQQSKEHGVFLEQEVHTVEEKVFALREEIQSLQCTIQPSGDNNNNNNNNNVQTTVHLNNASIDSHHPHQGNNEQKYTLEDMKTHYKNVEEQMRRYYHTRKAALLHQREAELARMGAFTAEYAEKRRLEYEQAQGELQALQADIKAAQDEMLRLQNEANMGNVPFLSSNSHTSVHPIPTVADDLPEYELDTSRYNTSKNDKVFLSFSAGKEA